MTILQTRPAALDESAHELIATFLSHVVSVVGSGKNSIETTARVKTLMVDALAHGDGACSEAWSALYRTIAEIVAANAARSARGSHAYLQTFIQENGDLADA